MNFDLIIYIVFGGFAALGFGFLFNVPKRTLPYVFLGGSVAILFRNGLHFFFEWSFEWSSFIGAFMVGVWTINWIHRVHTPAAIISIPSVIPLIPGVFFYRSLIGIIEYNMVEDSKLLDESFSLGLRAITIVCGIAVGVSIPIIWERKYYERKKRK